MGKVKNRKWLSKLLGPVNKIIRSEYSILTKHKWTPFRLQTSCSLLSLSNCSCTWRSMSFFDRYNTAFPTPNIFLFEPLLTRLTNITTKTDCSNNYGFYSWRDRSKPNMKEIADTIYGRDVGRWLEVISNVTFRKQRTRQWNGFARCKSYSMSTWHGHRKAAKNAFHNRAYAAARVAVKRFLPVIGCHIKIPVLPDMAIDFRLGYGSVAKVVFNYFLIMRPRPSRNAECRKSECERRQLRRW